MLILFFSCQEEAWDYFSYPLLSKSIKSENVFHIFCNFNYSLGEQFVNVCPIATFKDSTGAIIFGSWKLLFFLIWNEFNTVYSHSFLPFSLTSFLFSSVDLLASKIVFAFCLWHCIAVFKKSNSSTVYLVR